MDKIERRKRIEATLAAGGIHNDADKIEKWIRRASASYVAAGEGQWADSSESAFGKPIYHVSNGTVTLVLSQTGFKYKGPSPTLECRYDQIESIIPPTLRDYMLVRGDPNKLLMTEFIMHFAPDSRKIQLPARMGWVPATVLGRIVRDFT